MKSRWIRIITGILAVVVVFAGGFVVSRLIPVDPSILMVITADRLTSTVIKDDIQTVSISGVANTSTWFTDRPEHGAGEQSTDALLTDFFIDYPRDPPNVTISMMVGSHAVTRVVELANPRWDGTVLQFDSAPLTGDPMGILPANAADISITVDNYSHTVNGYCWGIHCATPVPTT